MTGHPASCQLPDLGSGASSLLTDSEGRESCWLPDFRSRESSTSFQCERLSLSNYLLSGYLIWNCIPKSGWSIRSPLLRGMELSGRVAIGGGGTNTYIRGLAWLPYLYAFIYNRRVGSCCSVILLTLGFFLPSVAVFCMCSPRVSTAYRCYGF